MAQTGRAAGTRDAARPAAAVADAVLRRLPRLIEPGQTLLVALSGGVDSVVLLHLLRFAPDLPFDLSAAHFDHRMRDGSADDAAWVRGLCAAWGVPLRLGRAAASPASEAEARDARYAFLEEARASIGAHRVATAHHADDQAETVLFRIARGAGLRGLRGIPERRGAIIRPLLRVERAALVAYAEAFGLRWKTDPTNEQLGPARNRVRLRVLPELERVAPGAKRALRRLARQAAAADDAWDSVLRVVLADVVTAEDAARIELARPRLLRYHPFVRARLLRAVLRRFGAVPDRAGTRAALAFISSGRSGGGIVLAGGVRVEREFDRIRVRRGGSAAQDRPLRIAAPEAGRGEAVLGGRRILVRWMRAEKAADAAGAAFALDALRFPLELRAWRPGDRIRLSYGTKKLKKLFLERRVPRSDRARTPVLADAEGSVVWVAGLARAAGAGPEAGRPTFELAWGDADEH